jgi:hypothetical protein
MSPSLLDASLLSLNPSSRGQIWINRTSRRCRQRLPVCVWTGHAVQTFNQGCCRWWNWFETENIALFTQHVGWIRLSHRPYIWAPPYLFSQLHFAVVIPHTSGLVHCPGWSWHTSRVWNQYERSCRSDVGVLRDSVDLTFRPRVAWPWDAQQMLEVITDWNTKLRLYFDVLILIVQTAA